MSTGAVSGLNTLLMKHELGSNSGLEGETPEIACVRHMCGSAAALMRAETHEELICRIHRKRRSCAVSSTHSTHTTGDTGASCHIISVYTRFAVFI